jgi:hypothetical protein
LQKKQATWARLPGAGTGYLRLAKFEEDFQSTCARPEEKYCMMSFDQQQVRSLGSGRAKQN